MERSRERGYFTHYWKQGAVINPENPGHTAGNMFKRSGVRPGDIIYIVTMHNGAAYLVARMVVNKIVSRKEARRLLPYEPWDAKEHVFAYRGTTTVPKLRRIPLKTARKLRFITAKGLSRLTYHSNDSKKLDPQALRTIRRLAPESAVLLDKVLGEPLRNVPIRNSSGSESSSDRSDRAFEATIREYLASTPERSRRLRMQKIRSVQEANHGQLECEVPGCGFNFFRVYGELGRDFAHVHHRRPLADRKRRETTLDDLAIVCANCHAMIHKDRECRPLENLIVPRGTRKKRR